VAAARSSSEVDAVSTQNLREGLVFVSRQGLVNKLGFWAAILGGLGTAQAEGDVAPSTFLCCLKPHRQSLRSNLS